MTKWVIDGQEAPEAKKRKKLPYREPFAITDKMPKGQATTAEWFNEMQARLIEVGEMEDKPGK